MGQRNSTSLKANRAAAANGGKFETEARQGALPCIASQKNTNKLFNFPGADSHIANEEREDCDSNESDDTVKLEDFQEAQNDTYHNDIMQALKSYPKYSIT